uniref:Transient receptor potential-gamma protein n=1 Tax=Ascaris suum TaxID=6253 RepID=F1KQ56_ASCSU
MSQLFPRRFSDWRTWPDCAAFAFRISGCSTMAGTGGRVVFLPRAKPPVEKSVSTADGRRGTIESRRGKSCDITSFLARNFRRSVLQGEREAVFKTVQSILGVQQRSQAEMITSLVLERSSPEPLKEALMTAICIGMQPLVELIISLFHEFPGEEYNGCRHSCAFPPHLTPLMLACMCNSFAAVEFLLLRHHRIRLPHRPDCYCEKCADESVRSSHAVVTLDTYIAISSDAFLWLACRDPLLAAFKLAADLEVCCQVDEEYKSAYWQLHENVMATTVRMVEQCWHMKDVEILLSQKDGIPLSDSKLHFPRLRIALDCHMRTFLATMNIQCALRSIWHSGWADYGNYALKDTWRILQHSLLLPLRAPVHILSAGVLMKSFNTPLARFISRLASYLFFLTVLLVLRLRARGGDRASNRTIKGNSKRL